MGQNENETIEIMTSDAIELAAKAEYDVQIATAKKYPRNIKLVKDNALAIATMDNDVAKTCGYSLPRDNKTIAGPSVHLARIIAAEYGNLRIEAKVVGITQKQVISQAVCFDLEKNYAVKIEVRRSIIKSSGRRYSDDMITVTGNAANAVAYRNAVFAVIPKGVTEVIYKATKKAITGDLSTEEKLIKRRRQLLDNYLNNLGVKEDQILKVLNLNTINQIKEDQIVTLIGLAQAIKDGDTSVKETFNPEKNKKADEKDMKEDFADADKPNTENATTNEPDKKDIGKDNSDLNTGGKLEFDKKPSDQPKEITKEEALKGIEKCKTKKEVSEYGVTINHLTDIKEVSVAFGKKFDSLK